MGVLDQAKIPNVWDQLLIGPLIGGTAASRLRTLAAEILLQSAVAVDQHSLEIKTPYWDSVLLQP